MEICAKLLIEEMFTQQFFVRALLLEIVGGGIFVPPPVDLVELGLMRKFFNIFNDFYS